MSGKYALIIANADYTDPGLAQLKAPGKDAKEFWRVLSSPDIGAFDDVIMLFNENSYKVAEHIEIFFEKKKPDDLILLYFSGHGVKDENGSLYLAVKNTNRSRLRSTAIKSDFIRGVMDECRSRRQVFILDCCNSGAFAQGTKAETGGSVGTATAFKGTGYGRVVLTASDSTQFAWEGDKVIGETENSLFTHFLIKGLEGEADRNGEGRITLDDLYDYAYDQIVNITPKQTPGKWSFKQQGEIILRERMRIEDVSPLPLPPELMDEIEDRRPYVREAAVQQLIKLVNGRNLRLARSAREALERIAENDDSRTISRIAFQTLEAIKQADANTAQEHAARAEAERKAKEQADLLAAQIGEAERLARLEAERKAKEEADRLAAQKAEAERLARLEAERKAKEEADHLAVQKAEVERLARLEAERKAKEEADLLAAQIAETERLAGQKAEEELAAKVKAEKERKAKEEAEGLARLETQRKAKEEADRLAAQKAEAEHLAKQKIEAERLARLEAERKAKAELAAKTQAENERKAKEKAERLAVQKAEAAKLAKQRTDAVVMFARARIDALLAVFTGKKPASRAIMFGSAAVVVLVIAAIGFRAFSNPGTTTATEAPTVQSTILPETQIPTVISETSTLGTTIAVTGPTLEVGSTYPSIDGAVLVAVPAGEFTMGDDGQDRPLHKVTLKDYWIYSTEVTNQQYALCVTLGKCTTPDENDNSGYSNYQRANDPVTGVTYEQAANYCEFVNGRLPSEAEWEKAAQSPQGGSYPWEEAAPSCDLLNFNNCLDGMASVVNYSNGASYYGALNMSGNAFEWVTDWYDAKYYTSSPTENPPGPASGNLRSVRSSSYASDADQVAVAIRNAESPQNHRPDLGFRCVVDDPTYFAPFCELPPIYANAATQDTDSLESCPALEIKPVQYCNNNIPLNNVTFVGPSEATIDPQDCMPSPNPKLYTCKSKGAIVSISADCQLSAPGDPSCPPGYSEQGDVCVADAEANRTAGNCLAGDYNTTQQCCSVSDEQTDLSPALKTCPVGSFYAAKANVCLPQPVQEIVTVSLEITLPSSCTSPRGGGGGGGGATPPPGGCQATQTQIDNCNGQAPFYSWNSATCSCRPAN